MKKFYTLALSALTAVSAFAAPTLPQMAGTIRGERSTAAPAAVKVNPELSRFAGDAIRRVPALDVDDPAGEEEVTWTELGEASFVECFISEYLEFDSQTLTVTLESDGNGNFRIQEPFKDLDLSEYMWTYDAAAAEPMVMHTEEGLFYIDDFATGWSDADGVATSISTQGGSLAADYGCALVEQVYPGSMGQYNASTTKFTYPDAMQADDGYYYNFLLNAGEEIIGGCNANGTFAIRLLGAPDYEISIVANTCNGTSVPVQIAAGADVADVYFLQYPGKMAYSDELATTIMGLGQALGTTSVDSSLDFSAIEARGFYTLFAVGVDAENNPVCGASTIIYAEPDDADQWTSLGMTTMTEGAVLPIYGVTSTPSYQVEIQENVNTPGFYRIVNPYGEAFPYYGQLGTHATERDHYIYLHAEDPAKCYIEEAPSGVIDAAYGELVLTSYVQYYIDRGQEETAYASYYGTKDATGKVTFPARSFLAWFTGDASLGLYYANTNGGWSIVVPGDTNADFSITVTAPNCNASATLPIDIAAGTDVAKLNMSVFQGYVEDSNSLYAFVAENGAEIPTEYSAQLDITTMTTEITPVAVVIAASDAEGTVVGGTVHYFFSDPNVDVDWKSIGEGEFTDDLINSAYELEPETYKVQIEENVNTPGYYRIVNPYGEAHSASAEGDHALDHNHYIYIHAEDPEKVYTENSLLGYEDEELGLAGISSEVKNMMADTEIDYEEEDLQPYYGTMVKNVITFPEYSIWLTFSGDPDSEYYANVNNAFRIVIPEVTAISEVEAPAEGQATYVNLQGMRVNRPANGLYIRLQGNKAVKTIVR